MYIKGDTWDDYKESSQECKPKDYIGLVIYNLKVTGWPRVDLEQKEPVVTELVTHICTNIWGYHTL